MEIATPKPWRGRWTVRAVGLAALVLLAGGGAAWFGCRDKLPKRFGVVVPGRLYRSGEVTPEQLAYLKQEYGLKRVICLLNPYVKVTRRERAAAAKLGLEWCNVPLPGNGASTPEERRRLVELLGDEAAGPTLVHCSAGVNRTGLAVGLYRLHYQGWTLEQVMDELRRHDFEDLPRHENLRQALAAEAAAVQSRPASRPAEP